MTQNDVTVTVPRLLSVDDLAGWLNVPKQTIYEWNCGRKGPKRFRVGKHIRYRAEDVLTWLNRCVEALAVHKYRAALGRPDIQH